MTGKSSVSRQDEQAGVSAGFQSVTILAEPALSATEGWPAGWDSERLVFLVKALAAAGLWADADGVAARIAGQLAPDRARSMSQAQLQQRSAGFASLTLGEALKRLRPIVTFGIDAGMKDPERVIRAMRTAHPRHAELMSSLACEWFARLGRFVQAVEAYRKSALGGTPDFRTAEFYRVALIGLGKTIEAENYLSGLAADQDWTDMSPKLALDCARALAQTGQSARAAEIFEALQAETIGDPPRPVPADVRRLAANDLASQARILGGVEGARGVVDSQLARTPGNLALIAKRIGLIFRSTGEAAAMAEALPLMREYPGSWELVLVINNLPFSNESIVQLMDARRDASVDAPVPPPMAIILMRLALTVGREDEARALAMNLGNTFTDARIVLSGRLTHSCRLQGDIRETGFHVARGNPGGPTILVFPGFKNRVGGWPIHYFDSLLASRGVTAIYAYDATQRLFLFGADGVAGNVEGVAAHIARLPEVANASRVLTFGTSAGGMIALRIALAIGASGSLTFGTKTVLGRPAPDVPDIELERLARFTAALPLADRDLRAAWHADSYLNATMFYGKGHAPDKAHAWRLADRPGVALRPVENTMDHDAFTPSLESGAFEEALDRLLGRAG